MSKRTLIGFTLGEVVLLVGALAGYLIAIAATLRKVSQALARVAFGVRAIERQTEPIGPALRGVNADLEAVLRALESPREPESAGG
ncbi:MAG: hypothetical protein M3P39_05325 [Actinomycetota bacterium]|nr:hypothetical protein [Actinomycetota bacterium]